MFVVESSTAQWLLMDKVILLEYNGVMHSYVCLMAVIVFEIFSLNRDDGLLLLWVNFEAGSRFARK